MSDLDSKQENNVVTIGSLFNLTQESILKLLYILL